MLSNALAPVHPGEILREEFLDPLGLSPYALASLRLARYFGTTPEFWLGIQARYDVEVARQTLDPDIAAIKPRKSA